MPHLDFDNAHSVQAIRIRFFKTLLLRTKEVEGKEEPMANDAFDFKARGN